MESKRKRWPALVSLIVGIAFIIGSFPLAAVGAVGLTLMDDDFENYRWYPTDPGTGLPYDPEIPDCTGYPNEVAANDANPGWQFNVDSAFPEAVPWKLVDECELFGMSVDYPDLFPFASTIQAAYCGFVNPNTGTASYDGIDVEDPVLRTGLLKLDAACTFIQASFSYWREVEPYGEIPELDDGQVEPDADDKNFDQTWVEVQFYDNGSPMLEVGDPIVIWYKDSAWPSQKTWLDSGLLDVVIPPGALDGNVQLSFHFEAVDHFENDYAGWFVDDVRVDCYDNPPNICWDEDTPLNLPQGTVGKKDEEDVPYNWSLRTYLSEYGSTRDMRFFLAKEGSGGCDCGFGDCVKLGDRDPNPLPERMTLSSDGTLYASRLTEDMIGNYTFWVLVEGEGGRGSNCACHEFHLSIVPDSTGGNSTCYYEDFDASGAATPLWSAVNCNPWKDAGANLWVEDDGTPGTAVTGVCIPDPDGVFVNNPGLYFGLPAECNYDDNGQHVKGCICVNLTNEFDLTNLASYEVEIGFKHYRDVEYYPNGAYDQTYVEVSTDGGKTWTRPDALYWDSSDSCEPLIWRWEQARTGVFIPDYDPEDEDQEAPTLLVRFCFDSVDGYGNDHFGWAIDEVRVCLVESTFGFTACPLPAGYVGEPYSHKITYTGGNSIGRIDAEDLPEGLEVVTEGDDYYIKGTPRRTGISNVRLVAKDSEMDEIGDEYCTLEILEQRCFFHEDFEADPEWIYGGEWKHVGPNGIDGPFGTPGDEPCPIAELEPDLVDNHVAYYGDNDAMNYGTSGARTTGLLSLIDNPAGLEVGEAQYIELSFDSCRKVEQFSSGYDQTKVQVRFDTATTWHTVWYKDSANENSTEWTREQANHGIPFEVPDGAERMWVRFVFDSVDSWYNTYFGWMVDNIQICFADEGGPIAAEDTYKSNTGPRRSSADELSVMNFPNPVKDVHTTTFTVRGVGVEAIRIQIFDQNETLVFEQQLEGQELEWHTDNSYGEYLANGTYYYRAYARVDGEWIPTKFEKLVILR